MIDQKTIDDILKHEVHYHFSKSGGHGGQNVNKRKTKAELYFDIDQSEFLDEDQKEKLKELGASFVHHHRSVLILHCQEQRYQHANKKIVTEHFVGLLKKLNEKPKQRIDTNPPKHLKQVYKSQKIKHSRKKDSRKKHDIDPE